MNDASDGIGKGVQHPMFKLYYPGRTYTQADWEDAPLWGIQGILHVRKTPHGDVLEKLVPKECGPGARLGMLVFKDRQGNPEFHCTTLAECEEQAKYNPHYWKHFVCSHCLDEEFWNALGEVERDYASMRNKWQ